jgi:hypothetical protein
MRTAHAALETVQLASEIPIGLPAQLGRIQLAISFRLRAVTRSARSKQSLARGGIAFAGRRYF